jgi:hypothetical protein
MDVDAPSTACLFGQPGCVGAVPEAVGHSPVGPPDEPQRLLRYEWHSPTGDRVVIEAGWPSIESANGGPAPAGSANDTPAVDLRSAHPPSRRG